MTNQLIQNLPGDLTRLPSNGLLYDEGVLDESVVNGEVNVYPMSAFEEIAMKDINGIINGTVITTVFTRCVPQVKRPECLYEKDVNHLLMVLRKITYGNTITITYEHDCENAKMHKYEIPLHQIINSAIYADPTSIQESYTAVMDNGQVVQLQPIKYTDIITLMQDAADYESLTRYELQLKMLESTVKLVKSVDGITDKEKIEEWCKSIPTTWFTKLTDAIVVGNNWGPQSSYQITCLDCQSELAIDIPLNPITFFLD